MILHHFCERKQKLASFPYYFFHLKKSSSLSLAFHATESNRDLAAFSAKEVKSAAAERRRRKRAVIPTRFLKIEQRKMFIGPQE